MTGDRIRSSAGFPDNRYGRGKGVSLAIPDPGPFWRGVLERVPAVGNGTFSIVGGWVRDLFYFGPAGLRPEIDLVTRDGLPEWARAIGQAFDAEVHVETDFLTARVTVLSLGPGPIRIDLSQFRNEVYPVPGALPRVLPGSEHEDLLRRDFTMNALMLEWSPSLKEFVRLVDPFGGRADLGKKKIRLIRSEAFVEDPTRILRWARFSVRMGLDSDPALLAALSSSRSAPLWESLGPARLSREFGRLLEEPDPPGVLKTLAGAGMLDGLAVPGFLSAPRCLRLRRWTRFRAIFPPSGAEARNGSGASLRLMFLLALCFGLSRRRFAEFSGRMGFGKKEKDQIGEILYGSAMWPFGRFYRGFVNAAGPDPGSMAAHADRLGMGPVMLLALLAPELDQPFWEAYLGKDRWAPPLVGGEVLTSFPAIAPSARGRMLAEIRALQRTGKLADRQAALSFIRDRISEGWS